MSSARLSRCTQAITDGGSIDSEQSVETVMPARPAAPSVVRMATPDAVRRIVSRKRSARSRMSCLADP